MVLDYFSSSLNNAYFILIINKLVLVQLYCPNEQWHGVGREGILAYITPQGHVRFLSDKIQLLITTVFTGSHLNTFHPEPLKSHSLHCICTQSVLSNSQHPICYFSSVHEKMQIYFQREQRFIFRWSKGIPNNFTFWISP